MLIAIVASLAMGAASRQDAPRIVFVSDRDGNEEIYSMLSDGSDVQRLTNDKGRDNAPCWSPDGKRIAFASNRTGNWDVWVMEADGSGQVNITHDKDHQDANPMWLKSENLIAFVSNRYFYTIRPDGKDLYERTGLLLSQDAQPSVSPLALRFCLRDNDGRLLIREGFETHFVIQIPYGQKGVPKQIYHPAYSTDGQNIIFDSGGATSKIYTLDIRDKQCDEIVMEGNGFDPVFALEDTATVFTSATGEGKGSDIYLITFDAASVTKGLPKPTNLTRTSGNDSAPNYWEPSIE